MPRAATNHSGQCSHHAVKFGLGNGCLSVSGSKSWSRGTSKFGGGLDQSELGVVLLQRIIRETDDSSILE
jgi:hypothetical protein